MEVHSGRDQDLLAGTRSSYLSPAVKRNSQHGYSRSSPNLDSIRPTTITLSQTSTALNALAIGAQSNGQFIIISSNTPTTDESSMDITQLLKCFPCPPTVVPIQLQQLSSHSNSPSNRSRRETMYTFASSPTIANAQQPLPMVEDGSISDNSHDFDDEGSLSTLVTKTSPNTRPSSSYHSPKVSADTPTKYNRYSKIVSPGSPTTATERPTSPPMSPEWEVNLNQPTLPIREFISLSSSSTSPNFDLLVRGCRGELSAGEHSRLVSTLLEMNTADSVSMIERANDVLNNSSPGAKTSKSFLKSASPRVIKFSKVVLTFGIAGLPVTLNTELNDEITIASGGQRKARFKILLGPPSKTHVITATQREGIVHKKEAVTISLKLTLKSTVRMRKVIIVEVEGGHRHFLIVQVESKRSAFGQPILDAELSPEKDLLVPSALVELKSFLFANGGCLADSIFRVPPSDEQELFAIKEMVLRTPIVCQDVHAIATLIKTWFRELPQPLLHSIDADTLLQYNESDAGQTLSIVQQLPTRNQETYLWLVDLLNEIASYESLNKMSIKNLGMLLF
eukprot:gene6175-7152_t